MRENDHSSGNSISCDAGGTGNTTAGPAEGGGKPSLAAEKRKKVPIHSKGKGEIDNYPAGAWPEQTRNAEERVNARTVSMKEIPKQVPDQLGHANAVHARKNTQSMQSLGSTKGHGRNDAGSQDAVSGHFNMLNSQAARASSKNGLVQKGTSSGKQSNKRRVVQGLEKEEWIARMTQPQCFWIMSSQHVRKRLIKDLERTWLERLGHGR